MIWEPKDASAATRRVTTNREMISETRTGHTCSAAFPQIDHLYLAKTPSERKIECLSG